MFRRLKVYTAYEFLGRRFDGKTRLLGAALFLLQRGLGAGMTIYAPGHRAHHRFRLAAGFDDRLQRPAGDHLHRGRRQRRRDLTQKYQIGIIFAGMVAAFCLLVAKLPAGLSFTDTFALAGGFQKLQRGEFFHQ
jgi:SSS family solute:Na+ symporter